MSKRTFEEPCTECGSTNVINSGGEGEEYCGDCGAVLQTGQLTANFSYEAEHASYFRHHHHSHQGDMIRYNQRYNQDMLRLHKHQISSLCRQLGLSPTVADRANLLFEQTVHQLMQPQRQNCRIFGANADIRVAACLYIGALELKQVFGLVDIASVSRISVYKIGRAVKDIVSMLDLVLPTTDPLLRIERTVNRVFGNALKCQTNPDERQLVVNQCQMATHTAKEFPRQILKFVATHEHLRTKTIELAGQVVSFDQSCQRHSGVNPSTLVGAAVVLALEHLYIKSLDTDIGLLKRSQRQVICKLVAISCSAGHSSMFKHLTATQAALVVASQTVPWLPQTKVTNDSVAIYLPDILMCYDHAQSWLFTGDDSSEILDTVSSLSYAAPAFRRAQARRNRRAQLLENPDGTDEASAIRRLGELGVDHQALLTLPLHTLNQLAKSQVRQNDMEGSKRRRLDEPLVDSRDMEDDEVSMYLH